MQQGLGRCAVALKSSQDAEKYKDTVLWGCLNNLSYDLQCEGTRAGYVYSLTTYFNDTDYFLSPVIEAFDALPRRSDELFAHLCDLLLEFAKAGNNNAKDALVKKYGELLASLESKRNFRGYDYERDRLERIAISLLACGGEDTVLKTAEELGALFTKNKHYGADEFDWLCDFMAHTLGAKKLGSLLKKASAKSDNIAAFYESYTNVENYPQEAERGLKGIPNAEKIEADLISSGRLSPSSKVRFARFGNTEEKLKLAEAAVKNTDTAIKAELLSLFALRDEGFPLPHEILIEYSKSNDEALSNVALDVLTSCISDEVKHYALTLLMDGRYKYQAIKMLISNYGKDVKEIISAELSKIRVDYNDTENWHSIDMKILDAADLGVKLPKELLLYVYETSLCSCCREYAINAMAKRRMLTPDIIEECIYDSNANIRSYATKLKKSRKS